MGDYTQAETKRQTRIEILNLRPEEVDAGKELWLQVRVISEAHDDLLGCRIQVMDLFNHSVAETELALFDGIGNDTYEFSLPAPQEPGEYTWTVLFSNQEKEGTSFAGSSGQLSFIVKPHRITLNAWGVPSPVPQGETFKVSIGAKCSAGCSLAGLPLVIEDDNHRVVYGHLGEAVLPQTNGVYWTEQELSSPEEETLHKWVIQCCTQELEIQHHAQPETFLCRTTKPSEHQVMIEVLDKYEQTPIAEAYVMLGLYKATTDANGVAVLEVPEGRQELYVTKDDFLSFQTSFVISKGIAIKAELEYCPIL